MAASQQKPPPGLLPNFITKQKVTENPSIPSCRTAMEGAEDPQPAGAGSRVSTRRAGSFARAGADGNAAPKKILITKTNIFKSHLNISEDLNISEEEKLQYI